MGTRAAPAPGGTTLRHRRVWFHERFFGTIALAVPSLDLQIALCTGQSDTIDNGAVDRLAGDIVRVLAHAERRTNSR